MSIPLKKLSENIDQIVLWLNENPTEAIPAQFKDRISKVLGRILAVQELTVEEWDTLSNGQFIFVNRSTNSQKTEHNIRKVKCKYCFADIPLKKKKGHEIHCNRNLNNQKQTKPMKASGDTRALKIDTNPKNEYKFDRALDGGKDFYKLRDNGKFGSYPLFDGMGDDDKP